MRRINVYAYQLRFASISYKYFSNVKSVDIFIKKIIIP